MKIKIEGVDPVQLIILKAIGAGGMLFTAFIGMLGFIYEAVANATTASDIAILGRVSGMVMCLMGTICWTFAIMNFYRSGGKSFRSDDCEKNIDK
jgi:hypothetical protein